MKSQMKQHVQSAGLNMQSEKVAFLAYYPLKKRQDNNSFEGNYNIGANVIMDVLNRYNIIRKKKKRNVGKNIILF